MTVQELFGIDLPIIQAPMAGVQGSALAVAVSNAGGLGSLPCAMLGAGRDAQGAGGDPCARRTKPFNVNFFCHPTPEPGRRARSGVAGGACALLRRIRHRSAVDCRRAGPRAVRRGGSGSLERIPAAGRQLSFRPAVAGAAGARARAGARRSCRRRRPSTKRAGSKRTASMRSSRRASRRAATAASS